MHHTNQPHDQSFSLTLALRDIILKLGLEHDLDDLHALMGLSLLVCSPTSNKSVIPWSLCGRDIVLFEAAQSIGLTIREMHPPEAAHDLSCADEFHQHFEASYLPLVERALENNQPVLAWQGWSEPSLGLWGCITGTTPQGIGLRGRSFPAPENTSSADPANKQDFPLTNPPVQLYVVETAKLAPLSSDALLSTVLDHARKAHSTDRASRYNVATGAAAYDFWVKAMESTCSQQLTLPWSNYAASIVAGHAAGLRFLEKHQNLADTKLQQTIAALRDACVGIIQSLETLTPDSPLNLAINQVRSAQQHAATKSSTIISNTQTNAAQ